MGHDISKFAFSIHFLWKKQKSFSFWAILYNYKKHMEKLQTLE